MINQIRSFFSNPDSFTEYGEPQLWISLQSGRSIEITHEEEGLREEEQYYSVRLHCSEKEFDNGICASTCGVMCQQIVFCLAPAYKQLMSVVTDIIGNDKPTDTDT